MKALLIEPNHRPEIIDIKNEIDELCELINCDLIECVYPYKDNVILICDESGMINGRQIPNRKVNENVIFGPFLLLGVNRKDDFISLTEKQINKYYKLFYQPEVFYIDRNHQISSFKVDSNHFL